MIPKKMITKAEHPTVATQKTQVNSLHNFLFSGGINNRSLFILSFLLRLFLKVIQNHLHLLENIPHKKKKHLDLMILL